MKRCSMLLACCALFGVSATAYAQSCAAPIIVPTNPNFSGDTCTASNELGTLCIFAQSPSNDVIYTFTLQAGGIQTESAFLTNNTPAWNAALVLLQGACNGNSLCPRNADASGPGGNESMDLTGLVAATYFLIVTSTTSDTGCGAYSLAISTTPVELQSFEVI